MKDIAGGYVTHLIIELPEEIKEKLEKLLPSVKDLLHGEEK